MKRKLLFGLSIILVASGLFLFVRVLFSFKNVEKGALQVTANIKSKVYLNGNLIGETQLCKCNQNDTLQAGEYDVRIEPQDTTYAAYTTRIRINGGVLTAVDRTFLPGSLASSYVLTLEKSQNQKGELIVTSIPEGAMVTIDSVASGATPFTTDKLSVSEHELEIQKQGFAKKTIRIRTVEGHKLIVNATLGTEGNGDEVLSTPTPSTTPSENITPSPTTKETVTILDTPNGFLRVRSGAGTTFSEVTRVDSGKTFDLLQEGDGWYEIQVDTNTTGWISTQFAEKK